MTGTVGIVKSRWIIAVCGLIVVAGAGAWYRANSPRTVERTLKVGFQNSPPYHFPGPDGKATGPVVEMLRIAAQRLNLHLEWTFSPQGPESALSSGAVDLWPVVGDLPERRAILYVSQPFAKMTYAILHPETLHVDTPQDVAGKTVAVSKINSDVRIAREYFGASRIMNTQGQEDVVIAV